MNTLTTMTMNLTMNTKNIVIFIIIIIVIIIAFLLLMKLAYEYSKTKWIGSYPFSSYFIPSQKEPSVKYSYIPSSLTNSYNEIPKIVYQTWNTHELPPKMKEINERLKQENPEFQYIIFDDKESREFIRINFDPSVLNAYDSLVPGAFKADLWRYCLLFIKGGIYLDIKYQLLHEKNNTGFRLIDLFNKEKYPSPLVVETSPLYVYTGLLMSPPSNPLYNECICRIVENVKNKHYGNSPMAPTGPELFGSLIKESDKKSAVLFYYDDYFLKEGEEEIREKYRKQGYIKDLRSDKNILSHYIEYRIEQAKYSKTGYWMNLWSNKSIYVTDN